MKTRAKIEFGDFQTPLALADELCALLQRLGETPDVVIEPTVGRGAFLCAAAKAFPAARLHGLDINPAYVSETQKALASIGAATRATLSVQDFFDHDWETELDAIHGQALVLGNPPWVTNAGVAVVNGTNVPVKENFMGLRGIAARTGKANFDISEWMLIRLLRALGPRPATLAMLCKTATARKFLRYAWQNDGRIAHAALYRIDAARHFAATVDACLLLVRTGSVGPAEADVHDSLAATTPATRLGLAGKQLVADLRAYRELRHLEGLCPFQWRSGVKHDCAAVMELKPDGLGGWQNGLGENPELESSAVFPLLKCSDLANGRVEPQRAVIITQHRVGDETATLAGTSPKTWRYLQSHGPRFAARKSSIYKAGVPFALFGIGAYSFAPWKVAVSGLHRGARFQVVGPVDERPVMLDDTCYFLPFELKEDARLVAEILASEPCQRFLRSLIFTDSKRPVTVDLLQRLDLSALAEEAGLSARWFALRSRGHREGAAGPQLALLMEEPSVPVAARDLISGEATTP